MMQQPSYRNCFIFKKQNIADANNPAHAKIIFICFSFQAVINSTVTPNMTFTKTSQKFGQWSDVRANTVYGLGFSSEAELNKVRPAERPRSK